MVGAPDHEAISGSHDATGTSLDHKDEKAAPPEIDLAEKKENLRRAAREFDPLRSLRERPFTTVGAAAVLGVVAASPAAARVKQTKKITGTMGIVAQIAAIGLQVVAARVAKKQAVALERNKHDLDATAGAPATCDAPTPH